jgi:negative regulator of flagellin synthesis FlgM
MSVDFFGIGGPGQIGDLKKTQKGQQANKTGASKKTDQVQFSDVLQDVNKAKQSESTMSAERAARVQELKAQIADGSYKPDLQKVASSLLQFIVEEK